MTRALLISSTFPPITGGSAGVYENICRSAEGQVAGLAPLRDYSTGAPLAGVTAHDQNTPYPIHRVPLLRPAESDKRGRFADLLLMAKVLGAVLKTARREGVSTICLGDL